MKIKEYDKIIEDIKQKYQEIKDDLKKKVEKGEYPANCLKETFLKYDLEMHKEICTINEGIIKGNDIKDALFLSGLNESIVNKDENEEDIYLFLSGLNESIIKQTEEIRKINEARSKEMETIFTNYINWLNSKTEQYVEYERDEKEKSVYFKKYTEIPSVFKFCLYISIPVIGWIYGIKKTEKGGKFEGIVGVSFDDDGKVNDVAFLKDGEHKLTLDKKDEKLLKDSYNNKWF